MREPEPAGPSATELARQDALSSASVLAGSVAALQAAAPAPAIAAQLQAADTMLHGYMTALSVPGSGIPTEGAASASGSAARATEPAGIGELIDGLAANSTTSLTAAGTADGTVARVLASGGAATLMQARALAAAAALPVPNSPYLASGSVSPGSGTVSPGSAAGTNGASDVASNGASGSPSGGSATSGLAAASSVPCAGQRSPAAGINDGQALLAATTAEQKAIYAYQVAATRLTDPASSLAVRILSAHEASLRALQDLLAAKCLAVPAVEPGYALAPGFTAQPAAALAGLEDQLGLLYGELIALSGPTDTSPPAAIRSVAITGLIDTAQHRLLWAAPDRPLPGLDLPADDGSTGTGAPGSAAPSAAGVG
ncbi:DUF4439 domain-containing protein [Arthrobacter sp. A5]|uniref:DUF4439 domain-containing protein n=1 Tax=Arthrobacter sp. A5 TaxID=576926 RepID=UPI003DA9B178